METGQSRMRPPPGLEALATVALNTVPDDCRLGDLSEQYARTHEGAIAQLDNLPGAETLAGLASAAYYLAATANIALFARAVDPGLQLYESSVASLVALDLREKMMAALQFTLRRFVLPALLLGCSALLATGAVDAWGSWRQTEALMASAQREKAEVAAQRIATFLGELERQIGWVTYAQFLQLPVDQRRYDYVRLLRQVPAITELKLLDGQGREQLAVSRLAMDVVGSDTDRSTEPAFVAISTNKKSRLYLGPVYMRRASEPYLTLAMAHGGFSGGVTIAEVNLNSVWDAVAAVKLDDGGQAYIVDSKGRLFAYRDNKFAVRLPDLSTQPQVAAALTGKGSPGLVDGRSFDPDGMAGPVLSASASVTAPDWRVVVDLPASTYATPYRAALIRAGSLAGLALAAAVLAFLLSWRPALPSRPAAA